MLRVFYFLCLFFVATSHSYDMTKDNPETITDITSENLYIMGFNLNQTQTKAEKLANNNPEILSEVDQYNPTRLYIYERLTDGEKGKPILYLIWKSSNSPMKRITIFPDARKYLSKNFRKLLTMEAIDKDSKFRKTFLGYPTKINEDNSLKSLGTETKTSVYQDIGLEVTLQKFKSSVTIVLGLIKPN